MVKTLKSIEKLVLDSLNQSKISFDKSLDFSFHITFPSTRNHFPAQKIQEIKLKDSENMDNLKIFLLGEEESTVHFDLNMNENSIFNYKKLKYFSLLSTTIFIHLPDEITEDVENLKTEILKFLFVMGIENYFNKNFSLTKIKLVYNEKNNEQKLLNLENLIKEIWLDVLLYTGINTGTENLKIENLFFIQTQSRDDVSSSHDLTENTESMNQENKQSKGLISVKNFSENSSPILSISDTITYLPENIILDEDYQKIHDSFLIGRIFNDLWLTCNNVINHWSSYVSNGKVIENFGANVSSFLSGMMEEFERTLPVDLKSNPNSLSKIRELSDMVQIRITSLFTSQLLILQTQALDRFKDILVWQAKHSNEEFEFEKGVAVQQVNEWFESKAAKICIPEMRLDFTGAKKELQRVLGEVTEKFKDSAVSKLISIQKTSKKTSKSKLKQSGIVAGFGITAAVRPRGFGNLQLVTSYTHGPHVFNFSLVNDLDVAEQEGQSRIKPIRIQPSLNFDVDI